MEADRARLQAELDRLANRADEQDLEALITSAERLLWNLRDVMDKGDPAEVRAALREMISKVVLHFKPRTAHRFRSPLLGGVIYLQADPEAFPHAVNSLREGSHMHHGLATLRKYLEPLVKP
jgi:hypothetical protein